jgi:hypothetical protein
MAKRGEDARPLPKRTRERLAACDAAGLHYWGDHPTANHVWAVDDTRQYHVVRIRRDSTAQHVCGRGIPGAMQQCIGGDPVPYTIPEVITAAHRAGGQPITDNPERSTMTSKSEPSDPFDPEALRAGALADVEVEKVLTAVPIKKPGRTEFVRVHPDHVLDVLLLEIGVGMDRQCYLVTPEVQHLVLPELRRTRLFVGITKYATVFLWPIKLPVESHDRMRRVSDTALMCAEQAKTCWTKVVWNSGLGGYEMSRAKGDLGEPQWPDKSFRDLIEIAFRHNLIDRPDHPVIRELEGEL